MAAANGMKIATTSQAYLEGSHVKQTKSLIAELCRQFYNLGWVSGTGGSITVKVHDDSVCKSDQLIVMSPSGVQKERMVEDDMYVLSPSGSILFSPLPKPYPHKPPKCSDCAPLFMKMTHVLVIFQAYDRRNAGAVIHSHGMESCLVTMIDPLAREFRVTHMEMIKGIQGHGYYDELVVPIIENTAHERELTESLAAAIEAYPKTTAVLVRNHGIYIWGDSWVSAKTQAECYHYLFDAAIKLHQLGLDWSTPSHGPIQNSKGVLGRRTTNTSPKAGKLTLSNEAGTTPRCVVLDIEGTTTPISFVTDVLFPYARNNVRMHLEETYDTGVVGAVPIPSDDAGKEEVIASLVANVEGMIKADRKITSLKQLQVYIYSSGSRLAQRLLFGYTNYGDLRKYLCGFFDTSVGNKKEAKSLEVTISLRPGNGPLPDNHGFTTVKSFTEIPF
ncbi:Class II aldolase/adducin N-terminal [Cynara cardunculus var. scolymus]|uniref:Probable methylthioribulose-1-phosphate dehydratase n=1 Tax=Cynara cardunculus var. scolymus TaxID=59895 RepID=A0A103Y483_CYNCS|nr:Class II aldolase/adducin N-terminal [Cynara cardunculus var. scolymus]